MLLLVIKIFIAVLKLIKWTLVIYIIFIGLTLEGKEAHSRIHKSYVF